MNNDNKNPNRLINEKSPYLLQHAYNPVDWYPWGEKAFEKAKKEDKPVFLSIGYSTCHWCHVMERESFESEDVAEILNRDYVSIKVDREERPDIDHIYMKICQGLTGSGGWPLTILMTPDQEAFYAATYLPRENRRGMPGIKQVLSQIAKLWREDREKALQSSRKITEWLHQNPSASAGRITMDIIERAAEDFKERFDEKYGGFGMEPKFPSPHNLLFLLRYYYYRKDARTLEMVEKTLDSMYRGGIYDHIGFGFSRYSTDRIWLVPHFEKMLYDNAMLAMAYLEAFQLTGKEDYAGVAREIFTYVLRDMTSPEGGFYSAEDADSEGEEGKFYIWSMEEILEVLGEDGKSFCDMYDITSNGNFEGKNIPNLIYSAAGFQDGQAFAAQRQRLFEYREKRVHPLKDDKVLTAWNGLMIAALAMGARVLGDGVYYQAARRAADFVLKHLRREDGRLMARYRAGESQYPGYASDYACMIWGLTELYEAGFQREYLQEAVNLQDDLLKLFWDEENGGLFFYGSDGEQLLSRPKESYDGAVPSDNAIAAYNFLRLAKITGNSTLEEYADRGFKAFGNEIEGVPIAYSFWLAAGLYMLNPSRELVIVGGQDSQANLQAVMQIQKQYMPDTVVVYKDQQSSGADLPEYVLNMNSLDGKPTYYYCQGYSCQRPVTEAEDLMQLMQQL